MKKNFVYAMMSAIALTGAVSLTSCSSNEEVADVNPTFDGESVKTSFTISLGDVKSPVTRMNADAVQKEQDFKGMTDIYLFPFKTNGAAITSATTEPAAPATLIEESYINLADFSAFSPTVAKAHGKIYKDVNLSVGVDKFLFYGAIATTYQGNGQLKASYLKMTDPGSDKWKESTWNPSPLNLGSSTVDDLKFDLVPINRGKGIADVQGDASAKATIKPLNDADAALTTAIAAITGSSLAETTAKGQLVEIQKTLRNELTSGTYTPYAGSSKSILSLMQMLYASLKNLQASLTIGEGADAKDYATDITNVLDVSFDSEQNATTGEWTLAWKSDPKFPETSFGVPDGAAAVQYVATNPNPSDTEFTPGFKYTSTSVEGLAVPEISDYTYPARLYYRVNTTSMVRDDIYLETNNNDTHDTWEKVKGTTGGNYSRGAIKASTRSVILEDEVQYAVGRLDVQVRVKDNVTIYDNTVVQTVGGNTDYQPVTVPSGGYKLTGVLIGGQKQVGWDFKPIGSEKYTIWDNSMTSNIYAKQQSDYSTANHTLAMETDENTPVKIALEFENNGDDFSGIDHNVIPNGTKFYLVANLIPKSKETGGNWTTTGETGLNQVFKQDYITTAKLTINENSLKSAYNVVPDLRSPKLEFGLSVNLEWREGLTFEIEF